MSLCHVSTIKLLDQDFHTIVDVEALGSGLGTGEIVGAHHLADLDSSGGIAADASVDGVVDVFGDEILAVVPFDELGVEGCVEEVTIADVEVCTFDLTFCYTPQR